MNFEEYRHLDVRVKQKYNKYYDAFPTVMSIIDTPIRHYESGNTDLATNHFRSGSIRIRERFWSRYLKYASKVLSKQDRSTIAIMLNRRFDWIKDKWTQQVEKEGYIPITKPEHITQDWKSILKLDKVNLMRAVRRKRSVSTKCKEIVSKGIENIERPKKVLGDIKQNINKEIEKMSDVLRSLNISMIVSNGDYTFSQSILCKAAQSIDITYVVIAHGYIQNPRLISFCPIKADHLILWTKKQQQEVKKVIKNKKTNVHYLGFPKRNNFGCAKLTTFNEDTIVLFVFGEIKVDAQHSKYSEIIIDIAKQFKRRGASIRLRPKPKDNNKQIVQRIRSEVECNISSHSLQYDLQNADAVVGTNTSVLVESIYGGVPTIQIKDLAKKKFDHVPQVAAKELLSGKMDQIIGKFEYVETDNCHINVEKHISRFIQKFAR